MFKYETKTLAEIVNKCLRQNGLEVPLSQMRLIEAWDNVAGKAISKYTGEKFIKNQTLFVKIYNPALRANLQMERSRLVQRLNKEAGCMVITEIKFF